MLQRIGRIGFRVQTGRTTEAGRGASYVAPPTTQRNNAPHHASGAISLATGTGIVRTVHLNIEAHREKGHGPGEGRGNVHRVDNLLQSPDHKHQGLPRPRIRAIGQANSQLRLMNQIFQMVDQVLNQSQRNPPLLLHLTPRRRGATLTSAHTK